MNEPSKAKRVVRRGQQRPVPELNLTPRERGDYGVIVTARNQVTGEFWTLHCGGSPGKALQEATDEIVAAGDDWRIVSISSPPSIFRDLQGTRIVFESNRSALERTTSDPRAHEQMVLGRIGRGHLLEPLDKTKVAA